MPLRSLLVTNIQVREYSKSHISDLYILRILYKKCKLYAQQFENKSIEIDLKAHSPREFSVRNFNFLNAIKYARSEGI